MSERAYTVGDIDDLRTAVANKWLWGAYSGPSGNCMSRSYQSAEKDTAVEQMVRTHMLAGHTGDDLRASEDP